jgi:hypothetical protein
VTWRYLDLGDFLLIAEAVLATPAEKLATSARLDLADDRANRRGPGSARPGAHRPPHSTSATSATPFRRREDGPLAPPAPHEAVPDETGISVEGEFDAERDRLGCALTFATSVPEPDEPPTRSSRDSASWTRWSATSVKGQRGLRVGGRGASGCADSRIPGVPVSRIVSSAPETAEWLTPIKPCRTEFANKCTGTVCPRAWRCRNLTDQEGQREPRRCRRGGGRRSCRW